MKRTVPRRGAAPVLVWLLFVFFLPFQGVSSAAVAAEGGQVRTFVGTVGDGDLAARLLRGLVESLEPERLELVLEGGPDASGAVRRLYCEARGVRQGGVRVDRIRLEALFVKLAFLDAVSGNLGDIDVTEAVQGYFEGQVTEKDLNDFLLGATLSGGDAQWRDLRLDLRPGGFSASARFASGAVSALVEIDSRLEIEGRDRLVMADYQVSVNNSETDMALVMEAIKKAQPLLDFREFPFPVRLRQLAMDDDSLTLATSTAPTRFDGVTLRYEAR